MFEMEEGFREFSDDESIDSFNLDEKDMDNWQDQPVRYGQFAPDLSSHAKSSF